MTRIIIFDTETTGLLMPSKARKEQQPRIIELGAMAIHPDGTILGELSQLLNPGYQISLEVEKITGLTNVKLTGAPTFRQFLPKLSAFFEGTSIMVAHNAPFDVGVLQHELSLTEAQFFPWPAEVICSVQEYTPIVGHRPSVKDLYLRIMGKELEQEHRGLSDVKALYEVLMADRFFEKIGVV